MWAVLARKKTYHEPELNTRSSCQLRSYTKPLIPHIHSAIWISLTSDKWHSLAYTFQLQTFFRCWAFPTAPLDGIMQQIGISKMISCIYKSGCDFLPQHAIWVRSKIGVTCNITKCQLGHWPIISASARPFWPYLQDFSSIHVCMSFPNLTRDMVGHDV